MSWGKKTKHSTIAKNLAKNTAHFNPARFSSALTEKYFPKGLGVGVTLGIERTELVAAEQAAKDLLTRFPDAHDRYDRLGMVHEARGNEQQAAECYRKVIEVIRRHPEDYESGSARSTATAKRRWPWLPGWRVARPTNGVEKTFAELVKRLDPPAKRARSVHAAGHKGRSKPPAT
jgi:hypothetical protein